MRQPKVLMQTGERPFTASAISGWPRSAGTMCFMKVWLDDRRPPYPDPEAWTLGVVLLSHPEPHLKHPLPSKLVQVVLQHPSVEDGLHPLQPWAVEELAQTA
jgi:hypothetical protein